MYRTAAVLVLALALAPAAGLAQEPARGAASQRNRVAGQLSAQEVVRMLDAYAVVQAQEALQLTDAQYPQFVTRLKKLQETRRRNQLVRNQIISELRQLAGDGTTANDESAIRDRLKALRDHDDRATMELRKAYDALDEAIDLRQQARFRIFEDTIERRKFDLLMRARQAARRGGSD